MALSNELISQFVKITQDKQESKTESTAYGKIVVKNDVEYVQLDGSELLTPVSLTTVVKDGDRVMVTIKNHTATVTGDLTNPSASNKDVTEIGNKISEFEIIIADKVTTEQLEAEIARIEKLRTEELEATNAKIETLEGKVAEIDTIKADVVEVSGKVTANEADITTLRSDIADFKDVTAEEIDAIEGNFNTLNSDYADFKELTTNNISANTAAIETLETTKLDTETAKVTYATIDFANINEAAVEKLFSDSGIIKDLIMSDGKVTGELVGVTIKGDIIEGNTVKADKLVILGEDGLYYKLNVDALGEATASSDEKYQNGLDGSAILAESITAEKISVDDLVAFGATIGGFHINEDAIYSGVKNSIDNTTEGIYLGDDGQINIGDQNNFFKYYIDENGQYKLEIQADSIKLGSSGTTIEEYINNNLIQEPISLVTDKDTELVIDDGVKIIEFSVDGKSTQETRSGKNLLQLTDGTYTSNGITAVVSKGEIVLNGTVVDDASFIVIPITSIVAEGSYTVSLNNTVINDNSAETRIQVSGSDYKSVYLYTANKIATLEFSGTYTSFLIRLSVGVTVTNSVIKPQLEVGSTSTEWEEGGVSPSPDYPSEIVSVGTYNEETDKHEIEVIHTGKNKLPSLFASATSNGIVLTANSDGSIHLSGTPTTTASFYSDLFSNFLVTGKTYAFSLGIDSPDGFYVRLQQTGSNYYSNDSTFTYDDRFTSDLQVLVLFGTNTIGKTFDFTMYPQIEEGVTPTSYEAHFSNSTVFELDEPLRSLPNGVKDVVYIDHGKLYVDRFVGNTILDGSGDWWLSTLDTHQVFGLAHEGVKQGTVFYSNYFNDKYTVDNIKNDIGIANDNTADRIYISNGSITVDDFKTWLSTHNTEVIYELATPVTNYIGELSIPMYKDKTNVYYVNDDLTPYIQCEYYTLYAERVADLDQLYDDETNYLQTQIIDQKAEILVETGSIIQSATESLVTKTEFGEYKETAKTEMTTTAEGVFIDLNKTNEGRLDSLENDTEDINTKLSKYFNFTDDGLTIGSGDSAVKLRLDNEDGIIFEKANGEVFGYWDGNNFYTGNIIVRVDERAQFGNYAYIPKTDGSLMFNRVK